MSARRRPARLDGQTRGIIAVVSVGTIVVALDTTIVNVALETLTHELHSSLSAIQWVVSGYTLALAAVIPMAGWSCRRFGARQVLIVSLGLFTAGSALCGLATSTATLVIFRVLQGLGGGMIIPVGQLIVANHAGPARMGRLMGLVSMPVILAPTVGPTLGGLILDHLSWRWVFFVNLPIGIINIALALRLLPATGREGEAAGRFDFRGLALLSLGLPLLVYGVSEFGSTGHVDGPKVLGPVVLSVILLVAFVLHARRVERPLLDVRLFANRVFAWAQLAICVTGALVFGGVLLWPLYFQLVRHESVLHTGLLSAPSGAGICVVLPLAGRLADRFGGGSVARAGVLVAMVATIPLATVSATTPLWVVALTLFVRGLGLGFSIIPVTSAAYASLTREQLPDGAAEVNVLQRVAGSLGTALMAVILQRSIASHGSSAGPEQIADAFDVAFWWLFAFSALSLLPLTMLARHERSLRPVTGAGGLAVGEGGITVPRSGWSVILRRRRPPLAPSRALPQDPAPAAADDPTATVREADAVYEADGAGRD
jgi:EmrB/QacA subfamily drug resistance transporter